MFVNSYPVWISFHITYIFVPSYEHEFYIGKVERMNRTVQDKISCTLTTSTIKSKKYGFLRCRNLSKLNFLRRWHQQWNTPYYLCHEHPYNFSHTPPLPFGCRVIAHNPTLTQTKISYNSTLDYHGCPAPFHEEGVLLYNQTTLLNH